MDWVISNIRIKTNSLNISKLEQPLQFFPLNRRLYIELYGSKNKYNEAFKLLNESICMGSGTRKVGPAGYTWVSYMMMQHATPTS